MTPTAMQTTTLTPEQRESLRDVLVTDREATGALIARLLSDLESFTNARTDSATDDEHDPEGPTMSSEWSRLAGTQLAVDDDLVQVDAALERLAGGSYGTCVRCGESIPIDRLRARPEASLCIACAQAVGG